MEKIKINEENNNTRVDQYLLEYLNKSRSQVQKMLQDGSILINGEQVKNSYKLKIDDEITIKDGEVEVSDIIPENIPLDIIYEDEYLIIINKANGMVVHPAVGNNSGTLVNALLYHFNKLSDVNGNVRPGIVHRIDADTTGLLVIAKDNDTHVKLAKQLEEKTVDRVYYALVWGVINNDTGTIDAPIGRDLRDRKKMGVTATNSKKAVTHFKVIKRFENATLLEVKLETGRTHQIRVHMSYINHPVVNDAVYSRRKLISDEGQCLHAMTLGFIHPVTNEYIKFTSELPTKFENIMNKFE